MGNNEGEREKRLEIGTIFDDQYEIIAHLGDGGMGSVYKARTIGLDRIVAIKILHASLAGDPESRLRFEREGKILSTLRHPNLPVFYHFAMWQQVPYIVMEYLQGLSLRRLIDGNTRIDSSRLISIATQLCDGMAAAHEKGIVHRDLKPDNIILLEHGESYHVKILDFGLARSDSTGQQLTQTGELIGSVLYMSPEQCRGAKADQRSDIYSAGCLLYESLVGEPPFSSDNPIGLMHLHVTQSPPALPPAAGPGWNSVIAHALAKEADKRYQRMSLLKADLLLIGEGREFEITCPKPVSSKRSSLFMLVLALSIVLTAITLSVPRRNIDAIPQPNQKSKSITLLCQIFPDPEELHRRFPAPRERADRIERWLDMYGSRDLNHTANAYLNLCQALREAGASHQECEKAVIAGEKAYDRIIRNYPATFPGDMPGQLQHALNEKCGLELAAKRFLQAQETAMGALAKWGKFMLPDQLCSLRMQLISAFLELGDWKQAEYYYRTCLLLSLSDKDRARILIGYASLLTQQNRKSAAATTLTEAMELSREPSRSWVEISKLLLDQGRWKEANQQAHDLKDAQRYLRLMDTEQETLYEVLSCSAQQLGHFKKAQEYFLERLSRSDERLRWQLIGEIIANARTGTLTIDEEALIKDEKHGNRKEKSVTARRLFAIASTLLNRHFRERALELGDRGLQELEILPEADYLKSIDDAIIYAAALHRNTEYVAAEKLCRRILIRITKQDVAENLKEKLVVTGQLVTSLYCSNRGSEAEKLATESIDLAHRRHVQVDMFSNILLFRAVNYERDGHSSEALRDFKEALNDPGITEWEIEIQRKITTLQRQKKKPPHV